MIKITLKELKPKSQHYLNQTRFIAELSKDSSTKVGALVLDKKGRVISEGRNGFPMGVLDNEIPRERKLLRTLHAEVNAILFAQRDLSGCTIFVSAPPCANCMAMIAQVGIDTVICFAASEEFTERWKLSCDEAILIAEEAKIKYYQVVE